MNPTDQKPLLKYVICLFLAAITFTAFAGVARCSFIALDDWVYVVENPHVQHGFSWSAIQWAFESVYAGYWIPVTWLSHILDCQLYSLNPGGHHLTNLAFHVANTVLLFLLLEKLTAGLWPSAFVALLFGIHPMHVESVAWIAERKDVLSAFFFLLTLLAYARYAELRPTISQPSTPNLGEGGSSTINLQTRWLAYGLALLFFTMGLMSKPMLVTLPFVLLLLDFWPLQRFNASTLSPRRSAAKIGQRLIIEKLPFFLLSAVFSYTTFLAQRSAGAVRPSAEFSLANRLAHVAVSYVWYVVKLFWPVNLSVFYVLHKGTATDLEIVSASLLLLSVTAFALFRVRANPYLIVGWLWFLGMMIPVIGLIQSGEQAYADRFVYLPYIGLFVIVAWGIPDLLANTCLQPSSKPSVCRNVLQSFILLPPSSAPFWAGAAVVAIACFVRTVQEVGYWRDGPTLLNRAIALDPSNEMAWGALGFEYETQGNSVKAIYCVRRSLSLNSHFIQSWDSLGNFLARKKDYKGAENAYQTALPLMWYRGDRIFTYNRLGDAFADDQEYAKAASAYQDSLTLDANQADTETKMGRCLSQAQQPGAAAVAFQNAIALQPNNTNAYVGLGMISQGEGLESDAIAQYRSALKADPNETLALNNLAWILAAAPDPALRNGPEAVSLAERACRLTHHQQAVMIGTLADAYAEAGRFDDAVAAAQKAHDVALANGEKDLADRNAQLLKIYKSHRAYHMDVNQ